MNGGVTTPNTSDLAATACFPVATTCTFQPTDWPVSRREKAILKKWKETLRLMGPQEKIAKGDISLKVMVPGIHNKMKVEAVSIFSSLLILLLLLRLLPCVIPIKVLALCVCWP